MPSLMPISADFFVFVNTRRLLIFKILICKIVISTEVAWMSKYLCLFLIEQLEGKILYSIPIGIVSVVGGKPEI